MHRGGARAATAPCCCRATSCPRSRRCATGSASSGSGKVVETGTLADLRHLTRTSIQAELAGSPNGLARLPGVHDSTSRATGSGARSTPPQLDARAAAADRERRARAWSASRRRWRSCSCGTTRTRSTRTGPRRRPRCGLMKRSFAGTATLVRLALRRDRVMMPVWIVVFVLMAVGSAQASIELYPDEASRVEAADAIEQRHPRWSRSTAASSTRPRSVRCRCSS